MSFSSKITLFRTEDATIRMNMTVRQAAKVTPYVLTDVGLRMEMRQYPSDIIVLQLDGGESDPNSGTLFSYIDDLNGTASLFIPKAFWVDKTGDRFSLEVFIIAETYTQRLGEIILDLAGHLPERGPEFDIDRSGSIVAGGVAQWLAPQNPNRISLTGQSITSGDFWISDDGEEAGPDFLNSKLMQFGQEFIAETNNAVSIWGATTGQSWIATERTT